MIKKIFLTFILFYGMGIAAIWLDGITTGYEKSEYAVVLGNQVYPSGEPSERLQARLNRAAELFRAKTVEKIIVSGGFGKEGYDEATVMKRYLEAQSVPTAAITTDSYGNNTRLTAHNTKQWANTAKPIIVVSQLYHVSRSKMAFEHEGFERVGVAYPLYFEWRDIYASLRELPAWVSYWFKGKSQHQRYYGWLTRDPDSQHFYLLPVRENDQEIASHINACQQGKLDGCIKILYTNEVSIELRKLANDDATVLGIPITGIQSGDHSLWVLPKVILAGKRSYIDVVLHDLFG